MLLKSLIIVYDLLDAEYHRYSPQEWSDLRFKGFFEIIERLVGETLMMGCLQTFQVFLVAALWNKFWDFLLFFNLHFNTISNFNTVHKLIFLDEIFTKMFQSDIDLTTKNQAFIEGENVQARSLSIRTQMENWFPAFHSHPPRGCWGCYSYCIGVVVEGTEMSSQNSFIRMPVCILQLG